MADCVICHRPQADTAYACPACAGRARDALVRLAGLVPELDTTIARQARTGSGGGGGDRDPLPVDLDAAADTWAVINVVTTWARHILAARGLTLTTRRQRTTGPTCRTTAGSPTCRHGSCRAVIASGQPVDELVPVVRWLATQTGWLRHQPEAADALDELIDAARLAARIVDTHAVRWYAGTCGAEIAHPPAEASADGPGTMPEGERMGACGADLYAPPGAYVIRCRACGAVHDADARLDLLLGSAWGTVAHAELIGRALACFGFDLDGARVRTWASRGHITPVWTRPPGPACASCRHESCVERRMGPRYRVGDVIAEAERRAAGRHARQVTGHAA
jgi:hypothetical protein